MKVPELTAWTLLFIQGVNSQRWRSRDDSDIDDGRNRDFFPGRRGEEQRPVRRHGRPGDRFGSSDYDYHDEDPRGRRPGPPRRREDSDRGFSDRRPGPNDDRIPFAPASNGIRQPNSIPGRFQTDASQGERFSADQLQSQGTGKSAAAGNANVKGAGSATSINQANQQADKSGSRQNALSANTAQGDQADVNGAAQSQGGFQQQGQRGSGSRGRGNGGGFNNAGQSQRLSQGTGKSAAAGDASAKNGQATSINQSNQESNAQGVSQNALSANSASGQNPSANGAAQASGNFQAEQSGQRQRWG